MGNPVEIAEARAERLPAQDREIFESFKRLGMSAPAALAATAGRDGALPSTDPAERLSETFGRMFADASPAAARRMGETAAVGRDRNLREVREALGSGPSGTPASMSAELPPVEGITLEERRQLWQMPLYKQRVQALGGDGPALDQAEREVFAIVTRTQRYAALGEAAETAVQRAAQEVLGSGARAVQLEESAHGSPRLPERVQTRLLELARAGMSIREATGQAVREEEQRTGRQLIELRGVMAL